MTRILALLEVRPTIQKIDLEARKLAKGSWAKLTKTEKKEKVEEAKDALRRTFTSSQEYQELAKHYWLQEKDFIYTFAARRQKPGLVDCTYEDLISLAHVVLLEVLSGHWGYWDPQKGPFQNFFRRALFHRFLTRLSHAGVLKNSAKKRRVQVSEEVDHGGGQTVRITTNQVVSLDYGFGQEEETPSLEQALASTEHRDLEESQVVRDVVGRLSSPRDQKMLKLMLIGLPHTEKAKEDRMVVRKHILPALRAMGIPVGELREEPTIKQLLGLSTHGFRYHKRRLAQKVAAVLELVEAR